MRANASSIQAICIRLNFIKQLTESRCKNLALRMLSIAYALARNLFGFVQSISITFKCWLATFFCFKELFE